MKKIVVLMLVMLNYGYAQDAVNEFGIDLKSNQDVFQIVNDTTKEVNLFISDRKKITSFILDTKLEIKDSLSCTRPEKKFKDIIGYSNSEGKSYIYWATRQKNIIYAQGFDLSSRKISGQIIEFPDNNLENEVYLESFLSGGKFYILKANKISKQLQLYELHKGVMGSFVIDTSNMNLFLKENTPGSIHKIICGDFNGYPDGSNFQLEKKLPRIDLNIPSTLAETAKKRKLYVVGNKFYLTIDNLLTKTQIIEVDLKNKEVKLLEFEKPLIQSTDEEVKSNSFLIDDKIFQLVVSPKELHLVLKDLKGNLIKEHIVKENDKFNIKNSPFTRERASGSERELETTSQFLRKIVRSNVGLTVYKLYDNYFVTLGCVSAEMNVGGAGAPVMGMGGFGTPMGGGVPVFVPSPVNFTMMGYYNYRGRRSISTNCLFNFELKHIPTELKDLAFDKIKKYETQYEMNIELPTIFRLDNNYIYGFYNSDNSKYCFRKFTE